MAAVFLSNLPGTPNSVADSEVLRALVMVFSRTFFEIMLMDHVVWSVFVYYDLLLWSVLVIAHITCTVLLLLLIYKCTVHHYHPPRK